MIFKEMFYEEEADNIPAVCSMKGSFKEQFANSDD